MSQGASTTPPQAFTRKPTEQEEADCPYLFEELEIVFYKEAPSKGTYYAKWRGQDVWSRHIKGPWHFDQDNEDITLDHWNTIYPGYKHLVFPDTTPGYYGQTHLNRNNQKRLVGKLNGKLVLWSPTKNTFVYTNNLTATFPPDRTPSSRPPSRAPSRAQSPEESQDEAKNKFGEGPPNQVQHQEHFQKHRRRSRPPQFYLHRRQKELRPVLQPQKHPRYPQYPSHRHQYPLK